jgi:hypothetical protein
MLRQFHHLVLNPSQADTGLSEVLLAWRILNAARLSRTEGRRIVLESGKPC